MSNDLIELESVLQAIDKAKERFISVAPNHIEYEAEKGFAVQLLQNNPYLYKVAQSSKRSLMHAVANVAAIGLSLNPAKAQAYLITRTVKVENNKYETRIFLEPSYRGLCDIITATGTIEWLQSDCVYSNDKFEHFGPGEKPKHTFNPFDKKEKRGEFIGVYSVAKTANGDYLTEMMPAEDVYSIRGRSEAWKSKLEKEAKGQKGYGGPWETDFEQMAKKSVIRRQFKMLPKTKELDRAHQAVHLSNENEGFEPILTEPKLSDFTGEQKGYYDSLIENSDALGMYVFSNTIDEATFTNLYHSFEKGQKGKYQRVIDSLLKSGQSEFIDYVQIIESACQNADDLAVKENMEDMQKDLIELIKENVSQDALTFINECGI